MSSYSGKRIHGYKWDELPIDEYVIEQVEILAECEKQSLIHDRLPNFKGAPAEEWIDGLSEEHDSIYQDATKNNEEETLQ